MELSAHGGGDSVQFLQKLRAGGDVVPLQPVLRLLGNADLRPVVVQWLQLLHDAADHRGGHLREG
eukprot:12271837-Prorocentrum_lima.AAC.1